MLNIGTTFHCIRAALPAMQQAGYGRIVNVASVTGPLVAIDGSSGYATAKAAVTGLTRATALEYARHGNHLQRGPARLDPDRLLLGARGKGGPCRARRPPGTPAEVAACCLFLASEEASYVNGAMLVVDGGNTLVEMKGRGGPDPDQARGRSSTCRRPCARPKRFAPSGGVAVVDRLHVAVGGPISCAARSGGSARSHRP